MVFRSRFDSQMLSLNERLIEMAKTVKDAISMTTQALIKKDITLSKQVLELEQNINEQEKDIESLCLKLLLHQNPVAKDLRMVSATLKMITDMERIGDQASDISDICLELSKQEYILTLNHFEKMGDIAIKMVNDSIEAFVDKDREKASNVLELDDKIDDLFNEIKDELYKLMITDTNNSRQALDLLMVAKYYERIGDHAENIAEWVIFSITGEQKGDIYSER